MPLNSTSKPHSRNQTRSKLQFLIRPPHPHAYASYSSSACVQRPPASVAFLGSARVDRPAGKKRLSSGGQGGARGTRCRSPRCPRENSSGDPSRARPRKDAPRDTRVSRSTRARVRISGGSRENGGGTGTAGDGVKKLSE